MKRDNDCEVTFPVNTSDAEEAIVKFCIFASDRGLLIDV